MKTILLRMPDELKERLVEEALLEDRSLNKFIVRALVEWVEGIGGVSGLPKVRLTDEGVIEPLGVLEAARGLSSKAKEVCKIHGTPLTTQGKCLQKGCRYS